MYDVAALGELLIDFTMVSQDGDGYPTMAAHPGGAPANYLAALAKYGARTALLGKVGNDTFGRLLIKTLGEAGISTEGLLVSDEYFTTLAFVTLDGNGDREFAFARKPGADTGIAFDELDLSIIREARVLHFGTLSLTDEPSRSATYRAVSYARERGRLISFDPNLRLPLWREPDSARAAMLWGFEQADVLKLSEEELLFALGDVAYEEGIAALHSRFNVGLVFLTLGGDGCIVSNRAGAYRVPALKNVHCRDTTGAGDIFGGSAMWRLLQLGKRPEQLSGQELREIAGFACAAAGLSTEKSGGISSVAPLATVLDALNR